jgi:hypothetical protein
MWSGDCAVEKREAAGFRHMACKGAQLRGATRATDAEFAMTPTPFAMARVRFAPRPSSCLSSPRNLVKVRESRKTRLCSSALRRLHARPYSDVDVLGVVQPNRADNRGYNCDQDRVPQPIIDVAGCGDDRGG